jgi:uncharacterized protein
VTEGDRAASEEIPGGEAARESPVGSQRGNPESGPPSPCIKVCALDAEGYCAGCLRTAAEIGAWISMSPAQQWQLIAELAQRRQRFNID